MLLSKEINSMARGNVGGGGPFTVVWLDELMIFELTVKRWEYATTLNGQWKCLTSQRDTGNLGYEKIFIFIRQQTVCYSRWVWGVRERVLGNEEEIGTKLWSRYNQHILECKSSLHCIPDSVHQGWLPVAVFVHALLPWLLLVGSFLHTIKFGAGAAAQ